MKADDPSHACEKVDLDLETAGKTHKGDCVAAKEVGDIRIKTELGNAIGHAKNEHRAIGIDVPNHVKKYRDMAVKALTDGSCTCKVLDIDVEAAKIAVLGEYTDANIKVEEIDGRTVAKAGLDIRHASDDHAIAISDIGKVAITEEE